MQISKLHIFGLIGLLGYLVIGLFAFPGTVRAQEVSLSIAPPITELTIQPGKSFSQTFTVKNDGVPVTIVPKIFPFVPFDKQGHAEIIEDATSVNVFADWFIFDPTPVSLTTTGSHNFIVKIAPPTGAEEKDYYFTFIIEAQNDNNLGVNNSQAQARVGANILLSVSKDGNPGKKASIIDFSAPKLIDSFSGLTYKVVIENSGFSFFKPTGKITIDQIFGSSSTLNLTPLNILVGGSREITCVQGEDIVPCKLPSKFLIGIYRANLSFTIDGSGASIEKQIYTIAFPFSIILGLAIIFIIYRIIRKSAS
jgi:hypothetical protein